MTTPISAAQIAYKKQVGRLEGNPVFEVGLIGGLHIVASTKNGKVETLGAGPHRAVARHIARKRNPEINWTELSKSDHVEEAHFAHLLPRYEALTDALISAQE